MKANTKNIQTVPHLLFLVFVGSTLAPCGRALRHDRAPLGRDQISSFGFSLMGLKLGSVFP